MAAVTREAADRLRCLLQMAEGGDGPEREIAAGEVQRLLRQLGAELRWLDGEGWWTGQILHQAFDVQLVAFGLADQRLALLGTPPELVDALAAHQLLVEEMRCGWQWARLVVPFFGLIGFLVAPVLQEQHRPTFCAGLRLQLLQRLALPEKPAPLIIEEERRVQESRRAASAHADEPAPPAAAPPASGADSPAGAPPPRDHAAAREEETHGRALALGACAAARVPLGFRHRPPRLPLALPPHEPSERRARRIAAGRCTRCGRREPRPGRRWCASCAARQPRSTP